MKKLLAIGAFFTAAWCSAVSAEWVSPDVNPKSVGTIHVYLEDEAEDGCWTNLREVREYAEEKLRMAGYSTAAEKNIFGVDLLVRVLAYKSNGQCLGNLSASLVKPTIQDGLFGYFKLAGNSALTNKKGNLNATVISFVQALINKM